MAFPNAQLAQRVVAQQLTAWSACSGKTIASHNAAVDEKDPRPENWVLGQASNVDNILSITSNWQEGAAGNGCQRAMAARANVVIDVLMCHLDVRSRAVEVVKAISAKIPQ